MLMANRLADFSLQLWLFGWNSHWWLQAMATFGWCIYATDRLAMATLSFSYCFSTYEKQWASWLWAEAALFSYPFIATWLWLHLAVLSQILPFLLLFHSLHFHVLSAVLTCMHYLMYFFLVICLRLQAAANHNNSQKSCYEKEGKRHVWSCNSHLSCNGHSHTP